MFDNLSTTVVQAIGFFGVFGFFVYQLLSDSKNKTNTQLKLTNKKINKPKEVKEKPSKNRLFGRKVERTEVLEKPKKKKWF